MVRSLSYAVAAIAVLSMLGLFGDFFRRFNYGMSMPMGIAAIGGFALIAGIAITRVGKHPAGH